MGTKRQFDEEFQQFLKHPKHLDDGHELPLFAEKKLSDEVSQNARIQGMVLPTCSWFLHKEVLERTPDSLCDAGDMRRVAEGLKNDNVKEVSSFGVEFETGAPQSLVNNIGEEVAGSGALFSSSLFPELFEFNFPRRQLVLFDDSYSSLLNSYPRKVVPLGPYHQADVPEFNPEVAKEYLKSCGSIADDCSDMKVGVCVIPMPDLDSSDKGDEVADERMECRCLDAGSIRCTQQHVKDAREILREILGHEKFVDLGFNEMGEDIALNWTKEEERTFHEVVYSNPASLGRRFWVQLSAAFPSRTKRELVSYFFNVFILRRRAAQNRSQFLEVDSDDEEWRGSGRGPLGVMAQGPDVVVGSFIDRDVPVDHGNDSSSNDGDVDDSDDDDGDGDTIIVGEDATAKNGVNLDSCTSYEGQQYVPASAGSVHERAMQENVNGNKDEASDGGVNSEFVMEPCDEKVWDAPCSMGLTRSVDLLPTCSMIEEIFGTSIKGKSIS